MADGGGTRRSPGPEAVHSSRRRDDGRGGAGPSQRRRAMRRSSCGAGASCGTPGVTRRSLSTRWSMRQPMSSRSAAVSLMTRTGRRRCRRTRQTQARHSKPVFFCQRSRSHTTRLSGSGRIGRARLNGVALRRLLHVSPRVLVEFVRFCRAEELPCRHGAERSSSVRRQPHETSLGRMNVEMSELGVQGSARRSAVFASVSGSIRKGL